METMDKFNLQRLLRQIYTILQMEDRSIVKLEGMVYNDMISIDPWSTL